MAENSLKEQEVKEEEEKDWYFTFIGQFLGYYAVFHGTYSSARTQMVKRHGEYWGFQYASAEKAGVEKYNLEEVK